MKLLLDEQISGRVAERLRAAGHDVTAVSGDPTLESLPDLAVFEAAQGQGRAVVTYDRGDFEAIARMYLGYDREHHGLVLVHSMSIPPRDLSRLAAALTALLVGPPLGRAFVVWLRPVD